MTGKRLQPSGRSFVNQGELEKFLRGRGSRQSVTSSVSQVLALLIEIEDRKPTTESSWAEIDQWQRDRDEAWRIARLIFDSTEPQPDLPFIRGRRFNNDGHG